MVNWAVKAASGGENVFKNQKILFYTATAATMSYLFILMFYLIISLLQTLLQWGIEEVWHFTLVSNANCGECHVTAETHRS